MTNETKSIEQRVEQVIKDNKDRLMKFLDPEENQTSVDESRSQMGATPPNYPYPGHPGMQASPEQNPWMMPGLKQGPRPLWFRQRYSISGLEIDQLFRILCLEVAEEFAKK